MTATDELRRMLDERGVKWEDATPVPSMKPWKTSFTSFTGEEVSLACYDEPKWIMGTLVFRTPEQAIAATLGESAERTCHEVLVDKHWRGCSECSYKWEFMYGIGKCERPNYCPDCGAKVVSE